MFIFYIKAHFLILFKTILLRFVRIKANLLIVFLQCSNVLPSLGKLTLLHALPDVPVDKGPLSVH